MQCHFEGTVSVTQPGKHLYQFEPGDRLVDYVHYFVLRGKEPQKAEALSQFEALSLSACKRKSGDKMWCGSCHDPHQEPRADEKVAYYRNKCLSCHGESFAAKHHPDKPECVHCHMQELPSKDVAHTQSTDHRILRRPGEQVPTAGSSRLEAFPESEAAVTTTRDLGLAWDSLAQRGIEGASREANEYLHKAEKDWPNDATLLSALGFVEQQSGHKKEAEGYFERALKARPQANTASADLGILEAQTGKVQRAVELWQGAFERAPYRSAIGIDLAMVFCAEGHKQEARRYVLRVLEFNPDYARAKQLLAQLNADPGQCKP
jgi:tetratricopeptide (TPR) repeat protein